MKANIEYDEIPIYHNRHGFVKITSTEKAIINSIYSQGLREIKQLSFTYYVLPGTAHTRFALSIGVLAIVGKILDRLIELEDVKSPSKITETDVKILRMSALLQGIDHYPFSHLVVTRVLLDNGFNLREINDIASIIPKS